MSMSANAVRTRRSIKYIERHRHPMLHSSVRLPSQKDFGQHERLTAAASLVKDTTATARVPICCEQSVPLTTLSRESGLPLSSQGNPSNAVPFVNERRPFRGNIADPSLPQRGVYNLMHRIGFRRGLPMA